MECAVCYGESGPFQTLCCGHSFCQYCLKTWYLKGASSSGANSACPMCRQPIYFRGFHKVREEWEEEAWETRCSEVLSQAIDEACAEAFEFAESLPERWRNRILVDVLTDLKDIESTWRYLKNEGICSEDIEYVLMDTAEYYSARHMDKVEFIDEPTKKLASRYPMRNGHARCGKRARANEDPWCTLSVYIEL